jgi:hypothetical protein
LIRERELRDGDGKRSAVLVSRHGVPGPHSVDPGLAWLLRCVQLFGAQSYIAAEQGMVCVAVGAVIAAGNQNIAEICSFCDCEIQLMSVVVPGVSPSDLVL